MRGARLGAGLLAAVLAGSMAAPARPGAPPRESRPRRNVIIMVADGLRSEAVDPADAPTLAALRTRGVHFVNSHSVLPSLTTPNAAAIATGHFPGDTGDFGNALFTGFAIFDGRPPGSGGRPRGSPIPFIEDNLVLGDLTTHAPGGNILGETSLLALGRANGFRTAAVGKVGPSLIQDVTQGRLVDGAFAVPDTVIVDDRTGTPAGLPLSDEIQAALRAAGLPPAPPPRRQPAGSSVIPGTHEANVAPQRYFTDVITRAILPTFRTAPGPRGFLIVYWSRDPDGTQHNQGDSLGSLIPGINGPTSQAAIRNVDRNLRQILDAVAADPELAANTDILVTADHGFATISKRDLDASGRRHTRSYAASRRYRDGNGGLEVDPGSLPAGFVAIDLAHALGLPLFDPDSQITVNGERRYQPVDLALEQPTATARARPALGHGLLGGTGRVGTPPDAPTDARVVVAANGGSDLIYLPERDPALLARIMDVLTRQDYTGALFVDDRYGDLPGTLPMSAINLRGPAALPSPALVLGFRSFATEPGNRYMTAVEIADNNLRQGQGMHGSFSRADTFNFMAAAGPGFKQRFVDTAPVGNADIAITVAHLLGLDLPAKGSLTGRVLEEALAGGPAALESRRVLRASTRSAGSALRTVLLFQRLGSHVYADEACFTALGPDRPATAHEVIVTAPEHAAICAVPSLPETPPP